MFLLARVREDATMRDLNTLADGDLEPMAAAAREAAEILRILAKTGDTVVGEILRGQGTFFEWRHYPPGDVYDAEFHAQYYYHAHPEAERRTGEHGHFHTFLRPLGMPAGVRPAPLPDFTPAADGNDDLSHLVAITMDRDGTPLSLFTTNRWVTGETWYAAGDVIAMLGQFRIDHARPSWPVNRWVSAVFGLFRPEIEALLRERDGAVAAWQARHPDRNVYEDRSLEVTSEVEIVLEDRIRDVERAWRQRRRSRGVLQHAS
jgi:hypothetical protein